jgi:hypothetical protein
LNLRPALRIKFIKKPGKLPDARLVRQPFNLVAFERIGESLVELGSQIYKAPGRIVFAQPWMRSHGIPTAGAQASVRARTFLDSSRRIQHGKRVRVSVHPLRLVLVVSTMITSNVFIYSR